jgi:ribosomal-protein-alanine N-acetyltransferase
MHVFLETARLVLRRFTEIDVDYLLQLDNEPEVMHFLTGGTPTPRAIIETKTLPEFRNPRGRLERFAWAAIEKSSGEFLGWFSAPSALG